MAVIDEVPEESLPEVHDPSNLQVEFVTTMRDREVRCRWNGGKLDGDAELLERLGHLAAFDIDLSTPLTTLTTLRHVVLDPITVSIIEGEARRASGGRGHPSGRR